MLPKFKYDQSVPQGLPFNYQVAIGRVPGFNSEYVVGQNTIINGQNAQKSLWNNNTLEVVPNTAWPIQLVSTSAQDDPTGIGAKQFFIYGLDQNFNIITEWITPHGTNPVVTQQSFRKILACEVSQGNANQGVITLTQTNSGTFMGTIPATTVEARYGSYVIPKGWYGLLLSVRASVSPSTAAIRFLSINLTTGLTNGSDIPVPNSLTSGFDATFNCPPLYPPTTFIQITVEPADTGTYTASSVFELLLISEEYVNPTIFNIQP